MVLFVWLGLTGCSVSERSGAGLFDQLTRTVEVGNWRYDLRVENQSRKPHQTGTASQDHYLKATLYLSNVKTNKSLLYSISKDVEDYEVKYKYLSFGSRDDLYIKCDDELIYPIGYVFEPSNGLSPSERLVYKFQLSEDTYRKLTQYNKSVEYWYIDRLTGLGKICFKQQ